MLVSAAAAFVGQRMTVAVCNVDELPAQVIENAAAEAAYVFWGHRRDSLDRLRRRSRR